MRNSKLASLTAFILASLPACASSPLATVSSTDPFLVDGHAIQPAGVFSSPVQLGNEVDTLLAPAVLCFADGSSVKLAAGSRVKLLGSDSQPKLVLLGGSLDYKLVLGSKLSVTSLDVERKSKRAVVPAKPGRKPLATPRADDVTLTSGAR